MSSTNRSLLQARDAKVIAGIQKRLQNLPSVVLDGVSYTPTTLAQLFQSQIDSGTTVSTAKGAWTAAVQADRALATKVRSAFSALQSIVRTMFANAPDALADFGMVPKKTTKSTLLTKVVASEKRAVTRDARHTTGKKEKLAISGDATPTEIATSLAEKIVPSAASASKAPAVASPEPSPAASSNGPPVIALSSAAPVGPSNGSHSA